MKKVYNTPAVEVERYQLDASIAANCGWKITLGPGDESHEVCEDDFNDGGLGISNYGLKLSFYEDGTTCNCYYSSGGEGYFSS